MVINVYIGYDSSNYGQQLAYEVCRRSILLHTNESMVNIIPLKLAELKQQGLFWRQHDPSQSTEFTYTRFLVPFLNKYSGYAVFCDNDFLWRCDIAEVLEYIKLEHAVGCVKHKYYRCPTDTKMDGRKQEWYPKKNWSSLMVFNCHHSSCAELYPYSVSCASPQYLHRFKWCEDAEVASLPKMYNYLVGYYSDMQDPKGIHFTDGTPGFKNYRDCEFSDEWFSYLTRDEKSSLLKYES
jgi:hypothetical protein